MYHVQVFRRFSTDGRWEAIDSASFDIGKWQNIGYWLDHNGYIEQDCKVEVTVG